MPFAVRNLEAGPAVFSDPTRNIAIEWQGADDEDGGDIQQVPDELADNVNFLRALQKGIFEVEEAPEALRAALDKQTASWRRKSEQAKAQTEAALDPQANNDIIPTPCVGPGPRPGVQCGADVLIREKSKGERPPLCSKHKNLAGEYVITQGEKIVDGKAETLWTRMGMTQREVQHQ
jgi:hypothetical protein